MASNSNNGGLSLTTAPPHPCHRTPICGTHVHCQGIFGRLERMLALLDGSTATLVHRGHAER